MGRCYAASAMDQSVQPSWPGVDDLPPKGCRFAHAAWTRLSRALY